MNFLSAALWNRRGRCSEDPGPPQPGPRQGFSLTHLPQVCNEDDERLPVGSRPAGGGGCSGGVKVVVSSQEAVLELPLQICMR